MCMCKCHSISEKQNKVVSVKCSQFIVLLNLKLSLSIKEKYLYLFKNKRSCKKLLLIPKNFVFSAENWQQSLNAPTYVCLCLFLINISLNSSDETSASATCVSPLLTEHPQRLAGLGFFRLTQMCELSHQIIFQPFVFPSNRPGWMQAQITITSR